MLKGIIAVKGELFISIVRKNVLIDNKRSETK